MEISSATFATPRRRLLGIPDSITGKGVRVAIVDSFFPAHPDLTSGDERKVHWLDAHGEPFDPAPIMRSQPGLGQHGLGRAAVAGGSGESGGGHYCGVAPECDMFLLSFRVLAGEYTSSPQGRESCLEFLVEHANRLRIRAVVFGSAGDRTGPLVPWQWDRQRRYCEQLTSTGVLVVSGTGNCPGSFSPTSLAPSALAGGGLELPTTPDDPVRAFHSPEGVTFEGKHVPEYRVPAERVLIPSVDRGEVSGVRRVPDGHIVQEGMSFGDPFMLGLLACAWQKYPHINAEHMHMAVARAAKTATPGFGKVPVGMPTWNAIEKATKSIEHSSQQEALPFDRYCTVQETPWDDRVALIQGQPDRIADILLNSLPGAVPAKHVSELAACYRHSEDPRTRAAIVLLLAPQEGDVSARHPVLDKALDDESPLVVGSALDLMRRHPGLAERRKEQIAALVNHPDGRVRYEALLVADTVPDELFVRPLIRGMKRDLEQGPLIAFFARRRCLKTITGETCWPETRKMLPGECLHSGYWLGMQHECAERWSAWAEAQQT